MATMKYSQPPFRAMITRSSEWITSFRTAPAHPISRWHLRLDFIPDTFGVVREKGLANAVTRWTFHRALEGGGGYGCSLLWVAD